MKNKFGSVFVFVLSLAFLLGFLSGCQGCQKPGESNSSNNIPPECGECLYLQTGKVCTVQGTMQNSCLAICVSAKILCNGECPCPKTKK